MLWHIIRKEIVSHVLSLRFAVAFILMILLVFLSFFVSVNEYERNTNDYNERSRTHDRDLKQMLDQEDIRNSFRSLFDREGRYDAIPVSPLSWIGQGLQPSYPSSLNTRRRFYTRSYSVDTLRNPLRGFLRIPDFVYIVNVVLSFLGILFMFDSVCGEKESGTLRLVLSNPLPRHTLLLGKWIGGYVVLVTPLLLAAVGGLVYARSAGGAFTAAQTGRVAALIAVALLYAAVFFNIGLAVSAMTKRPPTALLICLAIWVFGILVVPNMAPVTAKILEPTPPLAAIQAEKRAVDREIRIKSRRLTLTSGELPYGKSIEDARHELELEGARRKEQLDRYYKDSRKKQMNLAETFGRLSPSACWTYAALALAGTGPDAYAKLEEAGVGLAAEFNRASQAIEQDLRSRSSEDMLPIRFEDIPSLQIRPLSAAEALKSALNDVLILLILCVVFFMLAFTCFLRYDVR